MNCIQSGIKTFALKKDVYIDLFFLDANKYNYILQVKFDKK